MSAKKNYQFSFFFGFARYPLQMISVVGNSHAKTIRDQNKKMFK